jgi:hypothetical protein
MPIPHDEGWVLGISCKLLLQNLAGVGFWGGRDTAPYLASLAATLARVWLCEGRGARSCLSADGVSKYEKNFQVLSAIPLAHGSRVQLLAQECSVPPNRRQFWTPYSHLTDVT